jgi:hypothetical protein
MPAVIEIKYFNSFFLKKLVNGNGDPVWAGSLGIPQEAGGFPVDGVVSNAAKQWAIEEARITGGFNNTTTDFGVKAYIVDADNNASVRGNSLIYSGVFNSRTGVNNTNQFSVGEDITKSLDPANGTIQKLYAEDTNLIIFQENKVSRALIDKDAIYSAEGGGTVTSSKVVIGQVQAYAGNYGISRNPESFAVYGYRKYFADKDRNAVLRLSQDGITEISEYGMIDFLRDEMNSIDSYIYGNGKIFGGWDIHNKQYIVSLQKNKANPDKSYSTLAFDESVQGFTSFFTYAPEQIISIKNKFFTIKDGRLWQHYSVNSPRGSFYGVVSPSKITFVFNGNPSISKIFHTINYEGSNGWQVDSFVSDSTGSDLFGSTYSTSKDEAGVLQGPNDPAIFSYVMGAYDNYGNSYPAVLYPPINRAGFDRKENKYMAPLMNKSLANPDEVLFGNEISGIKGYLATVTMSIDSATDPGQPKELFSVSTNFEQSTY